MKFPNFYGLFTKTASSNSDWLEIFLGGVLYPSKCNVSCFFIAVSFLVDRPAQNSKYSFKLALCTFYAGAGKKKYLV
jgi:hypothetical protein